MHFEQIREYCLKKKGVEETFPFDEDTPVYKVMNKMFLLGNIVPPLSINIKCEPEKAVELRERYEDVTPGYHMSKVHWNTVMLDSNIPPKLIFEWIDDSYNLIVEGLTKKLKEELKKLK
ncbi:MAG TPA: MmcQ/YjbR family DNA-binding protein [Ignavibacteriaceae bacterium]|nr:MmcQ/YjbR family DNA-binding protein [Ignavibacteriaceae bacterium]